MDIALGEHRFRPNPVLKAILAASPEASEIAGRATSSRHQVRDQLDVQGAIVEVVRTHTMAEIRIELEQDLKLNFTFEAGKEDVMRLVYLGRDGDRADALAQAAGLHSTLVSLVRSLPSLLQPFASLKSTKHVHLRGGHYVGVQFEDPSAARVRRSASIPPAGDAGAQPRSSLSKRHVAEQLRSGRCQHTRLMTAPRAAASHRPDCPRPVHAVDDGD